MIQIGAVLDGAVMNLNHSVCLGCVVWPGLSAALHSNDAAVSVCLSLRQQRYIDEVTRTYTWTPVGGTDYR